jgi:ABC-type multidrug transport system fused ATPase/permease subunit
LWEAQVAQDGLDVHLLRDIWHVLTARQRRAVICAQILSIVMAFSTVTGIAAIAPFFAVLGDPRLIERAGLVHRLHQLFGSAPRQVFELQLGVTFMCVVFAANLINIFGSFAMTRLAFGISTDLQSALFGEYLHRPYTFHTGTHSANLFNNVISETPRVITEVMQNVFSLVTNTATATLIVITVVAVNPVIASAMIAALAGGYLLIYLAARNWLLRAGLKQTGLLIEHGKTVNDALGAIKEVLVLGIQDHFHRTFERAANTMGRSHAVTLLVAQCPRYVMECVAVVGLVLLALTATGQHDSIGPWLGQLTFLGFAAYRLLPTLQQAFSSLVRVRAERARFAAIAPDLRLARQRKTVSSAVDPAWARRPAQHIQLKDVTYRYQPDRPAAVAGMTLRIPACATVGLVGPNGCGKTTLVDLVAGLLVPAVGQIEIDGIALCDANRAHWQTRIAYVPQNISLLDTTIAQNVALGIPKALIDQDRLREAARLAQLKDFVEALPGGYEHLIGERGIRLSGGQRQRIGIARALYTQAPVLILDEATNALDGLTEQEVMSTIVALRGRYTIILIAHRLGSVRACDLIYELDQGKVVAGGTYGELAQKSRTFRELINLPVTS